MNAIVPALAERVDAEGPDLARHLDGLATGGEHKRRRNDDWSASSENWDASINRSAPL
jgi:hypothetical protein